LNTKLIGKWGEALAAEYLKRKKYKIVGMGYSTRFGEIDVIAENKSFIVFVEVKTRKNAEVAEAREFVDLKKQRRLISAASMWLASNETDKQPRFDVIEIYAPDGTNTREPKIIHIQDAFHVDT
jgi:putative endonuclease